MFARARRLALRCRRPDRTPHGGERGSFLIESIVAGAMLITLSLAFLAAFDTASSSSASNKHRSVAAALAQDDMERLRALKVTDLAALSQTRTKTVAGVSYTVDSDAVWVDDGTGNPRCLSGTAAADYLKVTSSVTWASMDKVPPVTSESIFAVPNGSFGAGQGSILTRIQNRDAGPQPGIYATLTGPTSTDGTSDSDGCVFWGFIPIGAYVVNINQTGYVTRSGAQSVSQNVSVTGGNTTNVVFDYDRAATIRAVFETQVAGVTRSSSGAAFMVANSGLPSPNTRTFTSSTTTAQFDSGATLFPFSDGYAVWAGQCSGADPRTYGESAPIPVPAAGATSTVTVRVPALNLSITRSGLPYAAAHVRITPLTPGCGSTFDPPGGISALGALNDPGLPYGDYRVCADDGNKMVTSGTIQNRAAVGTPLTTLAIPTSSSSGVCA